MKTTPAKNAANKGQAQYFTPPAWAKLLAKPLCPFRKTIVDLTCGNGQLLAGARTSDSVCLGLDIENMVANDNGDEF